MKVIAIYERTNYSDPFMDPENVLEGVFTPKAAEKFMKGREEVDRWGGACGYFTQEMEVRT